MLGELGYVLGVVGGTEVSFMMIRGGNRRSGGVFFYF